MGLVDGVNDKPVAPLEREKGPRCGHKVILSVVDGPVSLRSSRQDAEGMCGEARKLAALGPTPSSRFP
jgi:hypothetical protein